MTKPGCVQHDCDKCKETEQLIEFLTGRLDTITKYIEHAEKSKTDKLDTVLIIVAACKRRIKQAQQS